MFPKHAPQASRRFFPLWLATFVLLFSSPAAALLLATTGLLTEAPYGGLGDYHYVGALNGASGTYIQDGYMTLDNKEYKKADLVAVGMVDTVSAEQCVVCHNAESPFVEEGFVFDYEAKKDEGTHENHELKYAH